jgi:hypothetical protein
MRQLFKISFLLIYLLFNAGMSYSLHYCSEKLQAISLHVEENKCCSESDEEMECCVDVTHHERQQADQNLLALADYQFQKADFSSAFIAFVAMLHKLTFTIEQEESFPKELVHIYNTTPIHIQNQSFLI